MGMMYDVRSRNVPTLVQGLQDICVVGVSMHDSHTLALAADGSVYAFGKGPWLGIAGGMTHSPPKIPGLVCAVPH